MAIEIAVAISYRAPGVDFNNFLGLAREFAMPTAKIMAANLKPSRRANVKASWEIGPNSFRALPKPKSMSIEGSRRKASLVEEPRLKMIRKITLRATTIDASFM